MRRDELARSYAYCERLARRAAGNFYHAFRLLPTDQRLAMCALYSFLRVADDLADAPGPAEERRGPLGRWRSSFHAALEGDYEHPLHPALQDTVRRFAIPPRYLDDVLDGVEMDLEVTHYDTFADLYRYCYRVASAVGLACIHIWGFRGGAEGPAEAAGIALQLTNILRDVGEDAARGRVYLPGEDLERFGCRAELLRAGACDGAFKRLMRFEAERAYGYYERALPLAQLLSPPGRAVFLVMLRTYRGILDAIVACDFEVFRSRVRLPAWRKLWLVARALPVRFGLVAGA
jgi:phytoene synthase